MTDALNTRGKVEAEPVKVCVEGVMSVFQRRMRNILDDSGIEEPHPQAGEWYPLEKFITVLEAIEQDAGENALTKVGEATPEFTDWPSDVASPKEGLEAIPAVYRDVHENVSGGFTVERVGSEEARITSTTPYPTNWEKGFLKGTAEKFGSRYAKATLVDESDDEKVFELTW